MFSERLQILVSREQRGRLEEEARRTGTSVGALVREAIDARIGAAAPAQRAQAAAAITALTGRYLTLEELDAVIGDERLASGSAQ